MRREAFARALVATMTATALLSSQAHAQPSDAGKPEPSGALSASTGMINAILEIKPCVVLIETETADGGGYGTGFLVSADGHILTNDHVVRNAQAVTVYYLNKEKYKAQIVKKRPQDDLALLKITSEKKFPTVTLGDDQAAHGVPIGVTGYPLPPTLIREGLALDSSSLSGITSGQRQTDGSSNLAKVVTQMDAMISGGNSGSPVYTSDGKVVGVACAGFSGSALNFAVPISRAKSLLVDNGVVPQPNPVGRSMVVAPGDLSVLSTVSGNKSLHHLFGAQKTIHIDSRQSTDRYYSRSHHIFQAAVGHAPSQTTPLVAVGNKIQFGALDGTLYEYDTTYQELRNVAQADHPFYFYPVSNGQKVCIASGFLIPDAEMAMGNLAIHMIKGEGQLMSVLPSTGSIEWVVRTRFLSQPSLSGQRVYAGSLGALTAYDLSNGKEVWKVEQDGPGGDTHWFSPAETDGQLLASLVVPVRVEGADELLGRSTAYVAAYDGATGAQKWKKDFQRQNDWSRPMAGAAVADISKDRLFVVHCDKINAYQLSSGKELWAQPFTTRPDPKENNRDKLGPYFSPGITVAGDTLYVGCEDKNLYAISAATGQRLWTRGTSGRVGLATLAGGKVYVGTTDKHLYALDAGSGTVQWKYNCQGSVTGRPIVMGNRVYCTSDDGRFHAIRIPR
jgi:S1-C subfamily serine protease